MLINYIDNHDDYAVLCRTRWRLSSTPSAFLEVILEEEYKTHLQFRLLSKLKDT